MYCNWPIKTLTKATARMNNTLQFIGQLTHTALSALLYIFFTLENRVKGNQLARCAVNRGTARL